ncbi:hypothetical protein [Parabacteroides goldsteinii]|uniref:hypothetical protein n=1 Tax=Parabacteroides goldsteinii TaxID=328812 RepID=UPI00242D25CB|nr:hypothetical protein [Parabacteroides goldsteinii]
MKLRINVLTLMLGLLGGLFSCSQEELADIPDSEQACDVSLVLSIGDIQTKAATNYTYATEDELTIKNCHVAVFEVDGSDKPTNRIHFQNFSDDAMGSLTNNIVGNLSGYNLTLNNVRTFGKDAKKVQVLIVANADNSKFDNWTTYDQYVNGTLTTSSFESSSLVKVGTSVAALTYGQVNAAISISLNQLSAKIEYLGVYNKSTGVLLTDFSLSNVEGLNAKSQITIFDTKAVENSSFDLFTYSLDKPTTFYTYEINDSQKKISLSVNGPSGAQTFDIDANKLVKGNLYKIKGYYEPSITAQIKWSLEGVEGIPIEIKPFE